MSNNKVSKDDVADVSEALVDDASRRLFVQFLGGEMPKLAEDIPIAKIVVIASKIFNTAKDYHRLRMMTTFLDSLANNKKTIDDFVKLSDDDRNYIRGLVVSQLDLQTDALQAEAIAHIVDAYIAKRIDRLMFVGVLSEIKNTNPLVYYFNVDSIQMSKTENGVYIAEGATRLLPSAFGHNTVSGIGQWSSGGDYKYVVSELGQIFFNYVYNPMCNKYTI